MRKTNSIGANILMLFFVKGAGFIVPLAILPYLARKLGPSGFGAVAMAQSMALLMSVIVEYGFSLSATRDIARCRASKEKMEVLVCDVMGAKGVLISLTLVLSFLPVLFSGAYFGGHYSIGAWLYSSALGLAPVWYFQGLERFRTYSALDITGKISSLIFVLLLIRGPDDAEYVLYMLALGPMVTSLIAVSVVYKEVGYKTPTFGNVLSGLRLGASMFVFRGAISLYTLANVFVLGFFVAPEQVGFYASAEKLVRGASGMIGPVSQAIYPRVSRLIDHDFRSAVRLVQNTFIGLVSFSFFVAIFVFVFSDEITLLMFGHGYEPVVNIMKKMAWLIPLVAAGNVFGIQWMLSLKMDKEFNYSVFFAGVFSLFFGAYMASFMGANGMALAAVASEVIVVLSVLYFLIKENRLPISR